MFSSFQEANFQKLIQVFVLESIKKKMLKSMKHSCKHFLVYEELSIKNQNYEVIKRKNQETIAKSMFNRIFEFQTNSKKEL